MPRSFDLLYPSKFAIGANVEASRVVVEQSVECKQERVVVITTIQAVICVPGESIQY